MKMHALQIFLLIVIVIGIGLLSTQRYWVPKVVEKILQFERPTAIVSFEMLT